MNESSSFTLQSSPTSAHDLDVLPPQTAAEKMLLGLDLIGLNRRTLLRIVIAGLVISAAIAFLIPKRYEAVARLMPPDQSDMNTAMLGALTAKAGDAIGAVASNVLGLRTSGATMVGILESRTIQDDLINQFDLRKVYSKKRYNDARKVLEKRTNISEDKKSGIITIAVEDSDPDRAAALAKAYVTDLNNRISQLTTSSAHRERVFLEGRLLSVKQELDAATLKLSLFSSQNKTFDPQIEGKAMMEAASSLQGQLIAAETELKGLEQIYGPQNSRVRASSARVAELRNKLSTMSGAAGDVPDNATLSDNQLYPSLEQLPLLGNTYYDLARRAKIDEAIFEVLTKQYELAKVQEAKEIPSIKVLDEPVVPETKSWPPRLFIIVFGTLVAFAFGCVWILLAAGYQGLDSHDPRRLLVDRLIDPISSRSLDPGL
ncbi:MAG: GNVR domain-containing protein [Candidatus Korobacteraceae bacterium]